MTATCDLMREINILARFRRCARSPRLPPFGLPVENPQPVLDFDQKRASEQLFKPSWNLAHARTRRMIDRIRYCGIIPTLPSSPMPLMPSGFTISPFSGTIITSMLPISASPRIELQRFGAAVEGQRNADFSPGDRLAVCSLACAASGSAGLCRLLPKTVRGSQSGNGKILLSLNSFDMSMR
jgi:hypothetical protein